MEENTIKNDIKRFKKSSFMRSEKYKSNRDLINALLTEDRDYSEEEVNKAIKGYMRKVVY